MKKTMTEKIEWIPVTDRLPTEEEAKRGTLVATKDGQVCQGVFCGFAYTYNGEWSEPYYGQHYSVDIDDVIAWMPFPLPPSITKQTPKTTGRKK